MSRVFLVASLLTAVTSFASADRIAPTARFSQPPPTAGAPRNIQSDLPEYPVMVDRAQVRAKLAQVRADNLARFRAYQQKGVFPSNTYDARKLNVWRDKDGHLCAAATIINASGQSALVQKVAEQNNFIRLADVKQGPLMDWILTSGLTQDEIAAIQEPFIPVTDEPSPVEPRIVNTKLRRAEDARLLARYKQVDAMIVKNQKASLDAAADRLLKNPSLAARFMDSWATED